VIIPLVHGMVHLDVLDKKILARARVLGGRADAVDETETRRGAVVHAGPGAVAWFRGGGASATAKKSEPG